MRLLIVFIFLFFSSFCYATNNPSYPQTGNFALPASQQPGPLIGFGETIMDKNKLQLEMFADDYSGVNKYAIDIAPAIIYAITDNLAILFSTPFSADDKENQDHSSGIEDSYLQLEYAYYNKDTTTYSDQATIVIGASAPTGSSLKTPPTGYGSPSLFLGTTFNRTYVDWFFFTSPGAVITTAKNGTKFGNSYLYQFGFGRNIKDINGWILAWLTEIDGTYTQRSRQSGQMDPDSGGNVVYVTPSFWASTKKLILQFGVGFPITQNLYGDQTRNNYLLAANFTWTF